MSDKKKDVDPNTLHILREMAERKKLLAQKNVDLPPLSPDDARAIRRFEILPSNALSDDKKKHHRLDKREEQEEKDNDKSLNRDGTRHAQDPSKCRHGTGVCPTCGHSPKSKVTVSGDNYRQMYMEQQKQRQGENADLLNRNKMIEEQKKQAEKQRESEQMTRAHDIQDQITFWKQQYGQGQYDDGTINGMVSTLESELGAIPSNYWK